MRQGRRPCELPLGWNGLLPLVARQTWVRSARILQSKTLVASLLIAVSVVGAACAEDADSTPSVVVAIESALADLDQWIGEEANGQSWRKFLATDALRKQLAAGSDADPAVVSRVLEKYQSGANGLEMPRFAKVRQGLTAWLFDLRAQYTNDLAKMAWASRGDYNPSAVEGRLASLRVELQKQARRLEKKLGTNNEFAQSWKRYLRWELLEPHFDDEVKVSAELLVNLDRVLRRIRANRPGLEHPAFLNTTAALSNYRDLYAWHEKVQQVAKRSRKKYSPADLQRRVYVLQLLGLQKTLTQHQEAATVETTRQIAETLGLIESLQQSPQLVAALRGRYSQPNLVTHVSEAAINQFAKRPVDESQPVRDVILGAQIRGTAHSTGMVTFETLAAGDHIEIEVQIAGNIHSNTTGYKKPVKIFSQGNTAFSSTKRLLFSDDRFLILPACTTADTSTNTFAVRKTGGDFGRRLIEKIAWKQVRKNKSKSEAIASQHAAQKVSAKFDNQIKEVVFQARQKYDEKVRPPLIRTGLFPDDLQFSSTDHTVNIQARLASYEQVSTDLPAAEIEETSDFSLKVHETAVNNFLPTLLGGLEVEQDSEDEPPQIKGDVPPWLKELAAKKNREREEAIEQEQSGKSETEKGEDAKVASEFKPFSLRLNSDHPLSVSFDDQKLSVRIRIAEMKTFEDGEETIRNNWDFLVSYAVVQEAGKVTLRRVGDVETFPMGFDPRWDKKLSGEQVATRGALAKILKKRSSEGKGFPEEISLPLLEIPGPNETKIVPILQQLSCDDGWLTLGYQLP